MPFVEPRPRGEAFGTELAPFAAGRGSHRKRVRPAQRSGMHGLDLWGSDPGAKLFGHRAGAIRRGSRLPQKKGCDLHNAALCTGWICGAPTSGEALAPSWRHSPRVAAPTEKRVRPAQRSAMHGLDL